MGYFRAVLGKDSAWFDKNNPNEMATKIVKEAQMIQRGIGDKIGELYGIMVMILVGYAIAFYLSWELTLMIFGAFPVILLAGLIAAKAGFAGVKEEMVAYQQCAGLAEQSLQSVKVVHTYGREELESKNYNKYLRRTYDAAKAANRFKAFGGNIFGIVIGLYYGYCFSMGGFLRWSGFKTYDGSVISGGEVVSIIFLILLSTISLA